MQDSFDVTTIVFLALAVFVIWRLRSVLGQKTGREQPPFDPFARREAQDPSRPGPNGVDNVVRLPTTGGERPKEAATAAAAERWVGIAEAGTPMANALDEVARIEPGFDARGFVEGAKTAYEMIVT
ncbi:MAG: Tim44/TimA family putative adaptor protein, partial [Methylobacteriaceae bacterium]|nr:Tim44/TimA family putative adaptor protein [Methylobacteriaceae bacterium]